MSLALTANRIVDRVNDACSDVVSRVRLAAEDVMDVRPIDSAIGAIAGVLGQRYDVDELLAQIETLQREIDLLQQRDAAISRHVNKLDEEHRLAARVQHDFLPKTLPAFGAVRFHAIYRPAHYVSGDLYDVKRLDEQHVGIYLADAVGHGVPAALLTMFMKNALTTKKINEHGYELLRPAQTLATLNASLRNQNLNHASFATALYARLNCETRELCFARGGHPNPVLLRADGTMSELTAEGPLLGVFDDMDWGETCVTLTPGDRLFFYTDGIEAAFAEGDEPDATCWKRALLARRERPTEEILADFAGAIENHVNAKMPKDDLTVVVAEVS